MDEQLRRLRESLTEAGCSREEIADAERLMRAGSREALVRHLRKCRCSLLEELHECGRKIDRIDHLIRHTEQISESYGKDR